MKKLTIKSTEDKMKVKLIFENIGTGELIYKTCMVPWTGGRKTAEKTLEQLITPFRQAALKRIAEPVTAYKTIKPYHKAER
jgi:hypothetical protein